MIDANRHHHLQHHRRSVLRIASLAASLLALSCTSTVEPAPESGPCAARSGSYIIRATHRSGSCGEDGAVTEGVVNFDATTEQAVSDACTGETTPSDDNCSLQFTVTCKRDDLGAGWTVREVGKSTWSRDGSRGSGTEQVTVFRGDGIQECTSLADITWERQ